MSPRLLCMTAVVLALAGCSSSQPPSSGGLTLTPDAVRLAAQATFGPTVAVVRDIEQRGAAAWVDAQLQLPPSDLGTYPVVSENINAVCPTGSPPACVRDNFTAVPHRRPRSSATPSPVRTSCGSGWRFALSQILVISGDEVRPNYGVADYQKLLLRRRVRQLTGSSSRT